MCEELVIDAAGLHGLLIDLAESVGTEVNWPLLNGVLLHTDTAATGTVQAPTQPVRVHIGSQYQALVMPLQPQSVSSALPLFLPRSASSAAKQDPSGCPVNARKGGERQ